MASTQQENAIVLHGSTNGHVNFMEMETTFNLERDVSQHVNPAFLNNIRSILNECQKMYKRVFQRHCVQSGVDFYKTLDAEAKSTFLREDALGKALKDADKESVDLLKKYLPLSAYTDQEMIINQLKARNRVENVRLMGIHQNLQSEYIETMKVQVWSDFVQSMETEYFYLFGDQTICFYNQEKLIKFVGERIQKAREDFAAKTLLNLSDSRFTSFIDSIKNSGEDTVVKNKKHMDNCKSTVENLIHKEFKEEGTTKLEEAIHSDPFLYVNNEGLIRGIIDELKSKFLTNINQVLQDACRDDMEDFSKTYVEELETRSGKLVKYGVAIMENAQGRLTQFYNDIQTQCVEVIEKTWKANRLPERVRDKVKACFLEKFINECERDGFSSNFVMTISPSSDVTTSLQPAVTQATSNTRVASVPPRRPLDSSTEDVTRIKRSKDTHASSLSSTPTPAPPTRAPPTVSSNSSHSLHNGNSRQNQHSSGENRRSSSRNLRGVQNQTPYQHRY